VAYVRENCTFTVYYDAAGVMTMAEVVCHIQASEDGLSEVEAVAEYMSDRSPGVVDIVPILGCRLQSLKDSPDRPGHVTAKLALPAPLAEGMRHSYAYQLIVKSEERAAPYFFHELTIPTEVLGFTLCFDTAFEPNVVWSFAGMPAMKLPGHPRAPLPISDDGIYQRDFHQRYKGRML
jgi:hypothetical protein